MDTAHAILPAVHASEGDGRQEAGSQDASEAADCVVLSELLGIRVQRNVRLNLLCFLGAEFAADVAFELDKLIQVVQRSGLLHAEHVAEVASVDSACPLH